MLTPEEIRRRASALLQAGGLTQRQQRQVQETEAAVRLDAMARADTSSKADCEKERRLGILRETSKVDLFRREARKLLLAYPDLVQEIITIAHARGMNQKKEQGGGRLVADLLRLREALRGGRSAEEKTAIVDRTLSNK